MALPKCPNQNCESHKKFKKAIFELKEENIGNTYKYFLVQCSTCGTVIGILEYFNSGALIKDQELAFNNFLLKYNENNDKIYNELILQSEAIKKIMRKLDLDI